MPYKIIDVDNGFKVMLKGSRPPRYYSKNALTKKMATRQMRALYRSENQKGSAFTIENPDGSIQIAYDDEDMFNEELIKQIDRLREKKDLLERLERKATRLGLEEGSEDYFNYVTNELLNVAIRLVLNKREQTGLGLNQKNQKGGCLKKDEKMKSLFRVASQIFI
jgi:hypothetical protein